MIKHLHFLFASILMLAFGISASAQEVVFDFTPADSYKLLGLTGTSNNGKAGDITETKTLTIGDATFTITPSKTGTANRFWENKGKNEIRAYSGTFTISSTKNIEKIQFDFSKNSISTKVGTYDSKKKIWTPTENTNSVEFEIGGRTDIRTITVTLAEGGNVDPTPDPEPTPGEATEIYSVVFDSEDAVKTWTKEGTLANQWDFVQFDGGKPCMTINGYMDDNGNFAATYVVSPVVKLADNNTVSFTNSTFNFNNMAANELTALVIRTVGGEWEQVDGAVTYGSYPEFLASEHKVNAKFNGKEVQFGFLYMNDGGDNCGFLYLKDFKVMGGQSATPDPEPEPTETIAENIAAFNALCVKDGVDVTLNLVDAQVLYINQYIDNKDKEKQEVFVRDATGSVMFYNTGMEVKVGDIMNGSVKGSAIDYFGTKEFGATANTDFTAITITEGEAVAAEKTIAEVTETEISNLVLVKDVKMISKEEKDSKGKVHTNYYLVDSEGNELAYYNKFKIAGLDAQDFLEKDSHIFVGIVNLHYGKIQLCPTEAAVPTGIDCIENAELDVNAPMYNVAGQKVNANFKGIVLQNGKKFINK